MCVLTAARRRLALPTSPISGDQKRHDSIWALARSGDNDLAVILVARGVAKDERVVDPRNARSEVGRHGAVLLRGQLYRTPDRLDGHVALDDAVTVFVDMSSPLCSVAVDCRFRRAATSGAAGVRLG